MGMINKQEGFEEGEIFLRWVDNRIAANKNVISVTTGPTGSGKSFCDLRKAELIHKRRFKTKFPIRNCCFSIGEVIKLIDEHKMRKGEVIILEEAGVNVGSGDWQNKIVKMFNYILQAFRSMNIVLMMNLPVLGMLAKQARQLIHLNMETKSIDIETKKLKVKPLFHQLNQHSGKSYWKFVRVKVGKRIRAVESMVFSMPSKELVKEYGQKKAKFLSNLTGEFLAQLEQEQRKQFNKMARNGLPPVQLAVYNLHKDGLSPKEIAKERDISLRMVHKHLKAIKIKGYALKLGVLECSNSSKQTIT